MLGVFSFIKLWLICPKTSSVWISIHRENGKTLRQRINLNSLTAADSGVGRILVWGGPHPGAEGARRQRRRGVGAGRGYFWLFNLEMAHFDAHLRYSDVLFKVLLCNIKQNTVKLRTEAPVFYQYKWIIIIIIIIIIRAFVRRTMSASELNLRRRIRPPACMRGPAFIRG